MDSFFVNNRTAKDVLEEFCPKKNYEKTFETTQLQLNPLIFRTFCTIDKGHGIKVFGKDWATITAQKYNLYKI